MGHNQRKEAMNNELITALKNAREWLDELCSHIQVGNFQAAQDWVTANAVSTDSTLCEIIANAGGYEEEEA